MPEATLPAPATAFSSLAELRAEHAALLRSVRVWTERHEHPEPGGSAAGAEAAVPAGEAHAEPPMPEQIQQFLLRTQATGERIEDHSERDVAQGILDYWTATLVTLVDPREVATGPVLLAPFDPSRNPDLKGVKSPFIGLSAFQEQDAARFFGREEEIRVLGEKVSAQPIVLVVGPSGSGKSSLVRAGLVPRLREGMVADGQPRRVLPIVIPGTDPLAALLVATCPPGVQPETRVAQERAALHSAGRLRELVEEDAPVQPALLVIDQVEELFTLCEDPAVRERFAEALRHFALAEPRRHRLVLVVRDDFRGELLRLPAFAPLADEPEAQYRPPPMSPRELRHTIEQPAELVGLKFDSRVVDDLVKEVLGEPSALPLLQFTLSRLWEQRERNRITWHSYRTVGPPREALKRTADEVYEALLLEENHEAARQIFLALVQPSAGQGSLRRRVRREALIKLAPSTANHVLERFVEAGLLHMTPGVEADDDRFEVAHEALIRNWPRLGEWLQRRRAQAEKEIQLVSTAELWIGSGRDRGYLLSGAALELAQQHRDASPALAELVRESTLAQSSRRTWFLGGLAVAALVFAVVFGFLWWRAERAMNELEEVAIFLGWTPEQIRDSAVSSASITTSITTAISTTNEAGTALQELAATRDTTTGRQLVIDLFSREVDRATVKAALEQLGFVVNEGIPNRDIPQDVPTNALFYKRGVAIEDVKLVALGLLHAGAPLSVIRPMNKRQPTADFSVGSEYPAPRGPFTVEEIQRITGFWSSSGTIGDQDTAAARAREGFENLARGDLAAALRSFEASEAASNGYGASFEIANELRRARPRFSDSTVARSTIRIIVTRWSSFVPRDLRPALEARASGSTPDE